MAGFQGNYIGSPGGVVASSGNVSGSYLDALQLVDSTYTTAEMISGGKAVGFNQSGQLQVAMAGVSGRMPAIGVVRGNHLSGTIANVFLAGQLYNVVLSGTPWNFSGWTGQPLYVGVSGDVIASGAPIASGNIQQIIGVSVSQSGLMLNVGDPLEGAILQSGDIGSGVVLGAAGGGFRNIASGTLGTYDGSSGMTMWGSVVTTPFNSGLNYSVAPLISQETISGVKAVYISQSGTLGIAMASISGRMPAVGIVLDNVLSGIPVNVFTQGSFQLSSGMAHYSGWLGKPLFVGRSGQIVPTSGSWNSGGLSLGSGGDFVQRVATAVNSGAFLINVDATVAQTQLIGTTNIIDVANRGFGV